MGEASILQWATVGMGVAVMVTTIWLCCRFALIGKPLSRAFAANLFGEFIASAGTTVFSVLQLLDLINQLNPRVATAIRISMFFAMLASSIHMALLIRKIERG